MAKVRNAVESSPLPWARLRAQGWNKMNGLGNRSKRAGLLFLGGAFSLGGVTEVMTSGELLVQKDLNRVQVVRRSDRGEKILADVKNGFAANSLFKLGRLFPDSWVAEEVDLFDSRLFSVDSPVLGPDLAGSRFARGFEAINDTIRAQFFSTSIPFGELIHRKAAKYDVDPALVAAVVEAESRFKVKARSPVGARGLMQLMPRTGKWMGARDLYDADQNVDAGVKYLKYLDGRFNGDLKRTIAAYNAGEGTVRKYRGVPPYRETRTYVRKVLSNYRRRSEELERFGRTSEAERGALAVR